MAKAERSFQYKRRTVDDVRERRNMKGGDFDSIIKSKYKIFKVKDGKNIIRVLPPTWDDAKHYGFDLWVNYGIGVDNQSYLSLSKMKGEKDPLAEARKEAERDGDKKLSKALQPRQRIAMWVIDRNAEDEGPQIFLCPFSLDKDIINLSYDEDTKEVLFVDDPEQGMDIRFYKEGQGLTTKYDATKIKIMKPSPINEDEGLQEEWLNYINDNPLPECLQFYDYEHISSAFNGHVRTADDDEDEKPRRRQARDEDEDEEKPKARRAAPAEDEAEEDERPLRKSRRGNNEDDEEPAPRQRTRLKPADDEDEKPRSRVKPDEDDESEDEPEAEEKPKPSLRERLRQRRTQTEDDDD